MQNKSKRILTILAVCVLIVTAIPVTTQAYVSNGKIDGFNQSVLGKSWGSLEGLYDYGQGGGQHGVEIYPEDELRIPLTADIFTWDNQRTPLPREAITLRDLKSSKIEVRTRTRSGSKALSYVQFDEDTFEGTPFKVPGSNVETNKTAYISIMFPKRLIDVNEIEFSYDIYLSIGGKQIDTYFTTVSGVFKNDEIILRNNSDKVDLKGDVVAVATENNPSVVFDLGNGVTVDRRLTQNRKYYGFAHVMSAEEFGEDNFWTVAYPSIVGAYKLQTVNMRYGRSLVTLDASKLTGYESGKVYHAYGDDLTYYGTLDEPLYYSDFYFISTEEIKAFELDKYTLEFDEVPIDRITESPYGETEIDEGAILAKENSLDDHIMQKKFYEETSGSIPVVYTEEYGSVAYGDKKVDGNLLDPMDLVN